MNRARILVLLAVLTAAASALGLEGLRRGCEAREAELTRTLAGTTIVVRRHVLTAASEDSVQLRITVTPTGFRAWSSAGTDWASDYRAVWLAGDTLHTPVVERAADLDPFTFPWSRLLGTGARITGTSRIDTTICYVIELQGSYEQVWLRADPFLVLRLVDRAGAVTTFSDFRPLESGLVMPYRVETTSRGQSFVNLDLLALEP